MKKLLLILVAIALFTKSFAQTDIKTAAQEAYVYGLPLVLTDLTRIGGGRPVNEFSHSKAFPDHTFKLVVRPNNDTYYSSAFLDLGNEPQVLSIPDSKNRYYVVPLEDAWTNIFESFGKRTTGTKAQTYVITGPKWKGKIPAGLKQVKSPTDLVWIIGRIQVNSPEDGKNFVSLLQEGLKLTPLSIWGKPSAVGPQKNSKTVTYSIESSETIKTLKSRKISVVEALKRLTAEEYFTYLNELLVKNPGFAADKPQLDKLASFGIKAGEKFDLSKFDEEGKATVNATSAQVISFLENVGILRQKTEQDVAQKPDLTIGHYGTDYQKRAIVAYFGLGALGPEDAVYQGYQADQNNQPLHGDNKYVIHFDKGKTPPAQAFWSVTLYNQGGYLTENATRRYAIGDRNPLKYNADGSLDIYIQNENPGKDKEENWLPAPKEQFNLSIRIYWPTDEFLKTGNWQKPPLVKVN